MGQVRCVNEVFIDVLVFENFVMDFFILYMTSKLLYTGSSMRPRRLMLRMAGSSGVGVIYTVCSVLFLRSALSLFVFKILLSLCMVYVAFRPRSVRQLLKTVGCFYGVTLLTGGTALCVLALSSGGWSNASGESFFQWNQPVNYILIVAAIVAVVGDATLKAVQQRRHLAKCGADLYIQFDGEGIWIPALIDSGNELRDPCSGNPVVVAELSAVRSVIPPEIGAFLENHPVDEILEAHNLSLIADWATRIRLIPFSSLGCDEGMLIGFRADLVRIRTGNAEMAEFRNQTVCLCMKTLSGERRYRALLGSEMLEGALQEQAAIPA